MRTLSLVLAMVARLPLLGWLNWVVLPLALLAAGLGLLLMVVSAFCLFLGGGFL